MNYSEMTRRYFEAAPNAGVLEGERSFRGSAGSAEAGTWVQFDLRIIEGVVRDTRFLAFGCPHVIAVAAWIAEAAQGRALAAAMVGNPHDWRAAFEVPVEKLGRLLIVEDAWAAAIGGVQASADTP